MVIAVLLVNKLAPLLLLVLIALVITTGIDPVVQRLQRFSFRGWHLPRAIAVLLILVGAILVFLGILTFFTVYAAKQAISFTNNVWPDLQISLQQTLQRLAHQYPNVIPPPATIYQRISGQSGQIAGYLWSTTLAVFGIIGGIFSLVSVFILTLFLATFKSGVAYTLLQFIPPRYQQRVAAISHEAGERMGGWLRGQLILAVIITMLGTAGMLFSPGVRPYAAIIGIVGGIGELIPMVGPYAAFVPAFLIALATHAGLWDYVYILIFFIALSQVENFLLAPKVMERHVNISPVTTVFSLLTGGALLGIVGALLAIPLAAAGRVVLFEAVFPAIQGKTREEIEQACPGQRPPRTRKTRPAPPPPKAGTGEKPGGQPPAAAPAGEKKRGRRQKVST
jgi:predicted PurR-regulated permease PerM